MGVFNVGMTKEEALPTIVVRVSPFAKANWDKLTREIWGILLEAEVEIEAETEAESEDVGKTEAKSADADLDVEFIPGLPRKQTVYVSRRQMSILEERVEKKMESVMGGFDEAVREEMEVLRRELDGIGIGE